MTTYGFQSDFTLRRTQVKRYLAVVREAERELKWAGESRVSSERLNVLRAGAFLVLYNLVESAARSSIQELHDKMIADRVEFGGLRRSIRREVIKGFKRLAKPDIDQDMVAVPLRIVEVALDVDYHFSGNVDAKRLRDIAAVYGFSPDTDALRTHGGVDLVTIKNVRNDLAHGHKTYDEVGRQYTFRQILAIGLRAISFVKAILENIADYLDTGGFRDPDPPAAAA